MKHTKTLPHILLESISSYKSKKQIKFFAQFKVASQWYYAEPPTAEYGQKTIEDCQTFIDYIEEDAILRGVELLPYRIKEELV